MPLNLLLAHFSVDPNTESWYWEIETDGLRADLGLAQIGFFMRTANEPSSRIGSISGQRTRFAWALAELRLADSLLFASAATIRSRQGHGRLQIFVVIASAAPRSRPNAGGGGAARRSCGLTSQASRR
jgi:hypothetical protein